MSAEPESAFLVRPGWDRSVILHGRAISRVLFYSDAEVRIEHRCRIINGTQLIVAPALQLDGGHSITQSDPLSVTPSILCPDCGLHGFITDGRWTDV